MYESDPLFTCYLAKMLRHAYFTPCMIYQILVISHAIKLKIQPFYHFNVNNVTSVSENWAVIAIFGT
jgi:hypothetical protein